MKRAVLLFLSIIVLLCCAPSFAGQNTSRAASNVEVEQRKQGVEIRSFPEKDVEIHQKKEEGLIPQKQQPVEEKTGTKSEAGKFLGKAWEYFRQGNYRYAIEIFTTLSSDPALMWDAKYGLAMTYSRMKDTQKAVPLLEELIEKKVHMHDSVISLLSLLVEEKEYTRALAYSKMLEGRERLKWEETIRTGSLALALEKATDEEDFSAISELMRKNNDLLEKCKSPGVFLEAATALAGSKDPYALTVLRELLQACPVQWDVRLGVFYALKDVMPPSEMLPEVEREERRGDLDEQYKDKLMNLKVSVLSDQLIAAGTDSPDVERLAGEILKLKPGDRGTMAILYWWYFRGGQYDKSLEGFSRLVEEKPGNTDYASGLIYSLVKLKRFDDAMKITDRHYSDRDFSGTMKNAIYQAKAGDAYDNENYEEARKIYSELYKHDCGKKNYAAGLAYTLIKLKRLDEALKVAENCPAQDEDFRKIRTGIYQQKAGEAYDNKEYKLAESYVRRALELDPGNKDAKTLLAWSLFNEKRGKEALPVFRSLFESAKNPAFANAILDIYGTSGEKGQAAAFAGKLAASSETELKKVAADFYFANSSPMLAATTYRGADACYYNADKPFLEIVPAYRRRSGTEGFSKLKDNSVRTGFWYSLSPYDEAYFSVTEHSLYAGYTPANPFAGNASQSLPKINDLITSENVVVPEMKFTHNGFDTLAYSIALGVSPIGGVISPAPTFSSLVGDKNWNINIHQASVNESILSYTGLKDPYTDKKWGRVLKTGIEGELKAPWLAPYWMSLKGGYDLYHGNNVKNNNLWQGTLSVGRTFFTHYFNISPGIFVMTQAFKRNTDFFTFGHGGYYSPQHYYNGGPFVRVQTKECKSFMVEGMLGVNYFRGRSNSAPRYPLDQSRSIALIKNLTYPSSKSVGLGYAASLKGELMLSKYLSISAEAGTSKASQFTETKVMGTLTVRF